MMQCLLLSLLTGFASLANAFAADINLQQAASIVTHEPRAPKLAESFEVLKTAHWLLCYDNCFLTIACIYAAAIHIFTPIRKEDPDRRRQVNPVLCLLRMAQVTCT